MVKRSPFKRATRAFRCDTDVRDLMFCRDFLIHHWERLTAEYEISIGEGGDQSERKSQWEYEGDFSLSWLLYANATIYFNWLIIGRE